jgi:hypothetical protein
MRASVCRHNNLFYHSRAGFSTFFFAALQKKTRKKQVFSV